MAGWVQSVTNVIIQSGKDFFVKSPSAPMDAGMVHARVQDFALVTLVGRVLSAINVPKDLADPTATTSSAIKTVKMGIVPALINAHAIPDSLNSVVLCLLAAQLFARLLVKTLEHVQHSVNRLRACVCQCGQDQIVLYLPARLIATFMELAV